MQYETIIGFEVHVELSTATKVFCGCSTKFGNPANTQVCPVCLGLPGSLPVLNRKAVDYAIRAGLALSCRINRHTEFERKNYYYPDLPKNYQISQLRHSIGEGGHLDIIVDGRKKIVRINNIHLEEDAGKSIHVEYGPGKGASTSSALSTQHSALSTQHSALSTQHSALSTQHSALCSLVDLNRAGTPLLEIVSEPDIRSVEEAVAYMNALRNLLLYTQVSDCNMHEGRLRFEVNISHRPLGQTELPNFRSEIKNLASMKSAARVIEYETRRQTRALDKGEALRHDTRLWDEARGRTETMRSKEQAHDYRYFPEPDLVEVEIDDAWLERIRATLPELPAAKITRFVAQYGLPEYDAEILTASRALADYYEAAAAALTYRPSPLSAQHSALSTDPSALSTQHSALSTHPSALSPQPSALSPQPLPLSPQHSALSPQHSSLKALSNWIMTELLRELNDRNLEPSESPISPENLAGLVKMIADGTISGKIAKDVFAEMLEGRGDPKSIVEQKGWVQVKDTGAVEAWVDDAIAANPGPAREYAEGKDRALGFLVGRIMKASKGKANPQMVNDLIRKKLRG
jgi:aspartyl-tRNA(Asn)/glutamyl-tRNA(Gln) amidotransferase subunit B